MAALTHLVLPGARITNHRCLWLEAERTIVIADLHIGLEGALEEEGVHLPRIQTDSMIESIMRILDRFRPERTIILGDLKHEFSRNIGQELAEVRQVLRLLQEGTKVWVARGNHDNYLPAIAAQLGIRVEDGFRLGGISLRHGHSSTSERPLVIGHEHPSVRVFDPIGAYVKLPCFLHFEKEQVVVLPALSPLASGTDFTSPRSAHVLSPVLKSADLEQAKVYACSDIGLIPLGRLEDLKREPR